MPMATPMGRSAKPVEQGENKINAADQGQHWRDAADWEHFDSEFGPDALEHQVGEHQDCG